MIFRIRDHIIHDLKGVHPKFSKYIVQIGSGVSDESFSLVDSNLKVHNTKNLFVAGSSVFRSSGYSNPTFTIVQLSIRLGEKINKKLLSKTIYSLNDISITKIFRVSDYF